MLASGPTSRPREMCREMSQYMPSSAVPSETSATSEGSAAPPGRQADPAAAVADAEDEEPGGQHECGAARDEHLTERGSTGRLRLRGGEPRRRLMTWTDELVPHQSRIHLSE